ncbi:MAG: hypothetical protein ABEJ56_00075 [Candidatus Nanohaloarchaea archaeon]
MTNANKKRGTATYPENQNQDAQQISGTIPRPGDTRRSDSAMIHVCFKCMNYIDCFGPLDNNPCSHERYRYRHGRRPDNFPEMNKIDEKGVIQEIKDSEIVFGEAEKI